MIYDGMAEESAHDLGQFLTFKLAGEEYGVDILKVQEIKGFVPTTRIPNAPSEVLGVLNLRGSIVPIVDLRRRLNLPASDLRISSAIVVVVVEGITMGMVVDSVSEVITVPGNLIQAPPAIGSSAASLRGMAKVGNRLVILLDIDRVLGGDLGCALAA